MMGTIITIIHSYHENQKTFQISSIKVIDDKIIIIIIVSPVGIYDDDPEIITLSYSDFGKKIISITCEKRQIAELTNQNGKTSNIAFFADVSVEGSDDIWFINFYSPYCSHCHDLAPAVRYH